jgi:electron-transferring-flavoprotein dehydrogenase
VTFDKLSSVFASGNATRDDAPNHIRIQERVPLEVALMWQNMCPAQVYEVPEEELNGDPKKEVSLHITPSNCVQCGAITAKGGRLTPPEGGDGPNYQQT